MECNNCGGTEFYKEAGFFFCENCQVQSQEVREFVNATGVEHIPGARFTKIQSEKKEIVDNKITSWECYNYILLGLSKELINLGADKRLKTVVKMLWLRYLEKMGVFKLGENRLPKLQAVCSEMDGEIVYGKLAKRKRKRCASSSTEPDSGTVDSTSIKAERIKRKRALIKAQYEDFSQKSQGSASLQNETLKSLQTGSEKSSKSAVPISYNIYASRELKRIKKSKYHWHKHHIDFERKLKCHKVTYKKISHTYRSSPYILSLNKLYSILYLGLLILKDKIQLSDMLRFIKEGHLSVNCYSHFFPEDFSEKKLNFRNFKKNSVFASTPLRFVASEMSTFLQIEYYVTRPDLVELCERYCTELNLPSDIFICAKNIISRAEMYMLYGKRFNKVPNYEGRVLSIILFVMKLLFGLDDVTEFHLGQYADIFNTNGLVEGKMFNIIEWLKYIEYRDVVMTQNHFPTNFSKQIEVDDLSLPLGVLGKKEYPEVKCSVAKDSYKQMLTNLKGTLDEPRTNDFPVTLTPFLDYIKILKKPNHLEILSKDFRTDSLDHILKPGKFLEILNNPEVVHGGSNEDWVVEKLVNLEQEQKRNLQDLRSFVTVKLSFEEPKPTRVEEEVIDGRRLKEDFEVANEAKFKKNLGRLNFKDPGCVTNLKFNDIPKNFNVSEEYRKHYQPYERFWMRTKLRVEHFNQNELSKFVERFPYNFRVVFRECQRIAQQDEKEMLMEYQMTELRLVYFANYGAKKRKPEVVRDERVFKYLDKNSDLW